MIKNLIFTVLVMFMVFSQAQDQHSIGQKSLDCRNGLDEEKALSSYLGHLSKIQGVDGQIVVKVREILKDFIDYRRGSIEAEGKAKKQAEEKARKQTEAKKEETNRKRGLKNELTKLNEKESKASNSYQSILNEYYHPNTSDKRKKELWQKYTEERPKFFREARDHYSKVKRNRLRFEILEAYEKRAERIQQANKSEAASEKNELIKHQDGAVTLKITQKVSAESERLRLRQNLRASDFTPTGFYLPPGAKLELEVKPEKEGDPLPKIIVDTYGRGVFHCFGKKVPEKDKEKNCPLTFIAREKELKVGRNSISDPFGGLIYIRYVDDHPSNSTAHISFLKGMKPAPFFRLGKTTREEWLKMLQEDKYKESPDVILEGERVMIVVSRDKAIQYKDEDQEEVLGAADNIIRFQDEFSGLDGSSKEHKPNAHKYLMTQDDIRLGSPFLGEANNYYTTYKSLYISDLMTKEGLLIDGGTVWHELGHMHQQSEWTWRSINEIGAVFYVWITQRKIGYFYDYNGNQYQKMIKYLALPEDQRDFNQYDSNSLYDPGHVRGSFLKQLYKAYGEDFYKKLHRYVREHPKDLNTDEEKMKYFMLVACHASGNNLEEVFKKWGFKVGEEVYREISSLSSSNNYPHPDEETQKKLIPEENRYDRLRQEVGIQIDKEKIHMQLNTDWIKKEEVKLRFIVRELDKDDFHIGNCEFEEIIKGGRTIQEFEYLIKDKCTGYNRIDRGEGLTDRKIQLEVLIDDERKPLYKTDFTILNFD